MSSAPPGEIRLKVAYKDVSTMLGEFTRSVGRGSVTLEAARPIAIGTRFVFELQAKGVKDRLEVIGEVIRVEPSTAGRFQVQIRYDPKADRSVVDGLLQKILEQHRLEKARVHPRTPLFLRASEERPQAPTFLIRDISLGGLGMELEGGSFPRSVHVGAPALVEIWLTQGTLMLHGEIVWLASMSEGTPALFRPGLGIRFGKLRPETLSPLESILRLRGLPPPPWRARVSFGLNAVERMP